jgi:poly(3-hydroxybutyrate) depolymerase
VLAAVSLMAAGGAAAAPLTMTLIGGPIDARKSRTTMKYLELKPTLSWFERNLIDRVPAKYPGCMRSVYPGFLQQYQRLLQGDGESAEAQRFYDEYNAVIDIPAEFYLDTVKTVFLDCALPQGRMLVRDELVRPQAIRDTALLTVEGERDDISGSGQTEAAHALCANIPSERREHYLAPGVGHFGIFSGRRWRELVFPRLRHFIRQHALGDRPRLLPKLFAVQKSASEKSGTDHV